MARGSRGLVLLLAVALTLGVVVSARAADETWLLGRWELVHSPDGDPTDWLEFAPDGRMTSIAPNGRRTGGRYVTTGQQVELNFKVETQSIIRTLTYEPGKQQRLYAKSAKTGNTAVYEKRP